jgi:hypothetical protein
LVIKWGFFLGFCVIPTEIDPINGISAPAKRPRPALAKENPLE